MKKHLLPFWSICCERRMQRTEVIWNTIHLSVQLSYPYVEAANYLSTDSLLMCLAEEEMSDLSDLIMEPALWELQQN